jgi:hypothetical protein
MITIGDKKYPTSKPANLDATLLGATGCDAAETRAMLAGRPHASHLARGLLPFLAEKDAPSLAELSREIAAIDDREELTAAIRALYDAASAPTPPSKTE